MIDFNSCQTLPHAIPGVAAWFKDVRLYNSSMLLWRRCIDNYDSYDPSKTSNICCCILQGTFQTSNQTAFVWYYGTIPTLHANSCQVALAARSDRPYRLLWGASDLQHDGTHSTHKLLAHHFHQAVNQLILGKSILKQTWIYDFPKHWKPKILQYTGHFWQKLMA